LQFLEKRFVRWVFDMLHQWAQLKLPILRNLL